MTKCSLCGYEFDEKSLACHSQCPMSDGCAIICCPNCGYQVVDDSKAMGVSILRKMLSRWKRRAPSAARNDGDEVRRRTHSLDDLLPGESAEVVAISSADEGRLMKLSALGIVPGSRLRIVQHFPVCILWVGETQLSLDSSVAREILVSLPG